MNQKTLFYKCNHCGNIFLIVNDGHVNPVCCNEKMQKLVAGLQEASLEKHIPVVSVNGNIVTVNVGEIAHPMLKEHRIEWIYVDTKNGGILKRLEVAEDPKATFALVEDEIIEVYAYCNIHGLWQYIVK